MASVAEKRIVSPRKTAPALISWEDFQRKYLEREDRWKYEWVNGSAQKTEQKMDKTQNYILANLLDFLFELKAANPKIDGQLIAEGNNFFAGNHRRPDIAYWAKAQLKAGRRNEEVLLDFVIDVISTNDQSLKVEDKMADYRRAGVQIVWHIFPKQQVVHVYRGKQMTICTSDDLCSAEPVIEGFSLPVSEVFK